MAETETSRPREETGNRRRLDGIDTLRGVSILAVVMLHIDLRIHLAETSLGHLLPWPVVHALVWNGQNGVTIFFAVSGFLITSMTMQRWGKLSSVNLRHFYLLRFARIAPLLLLLFAILSVFDLFHLPGFTIHPEQGSLARALFSALTFHLNWLEARHGYLPGSWDVMWSLSIEEMFYLFFPLLCWWLRTRWLVMLLCIFVVLGPFARVVFTHNPIWVEKSYLGSMDAIALGCLAAMLLPRLRMQRMRLWVMQGAGAAMIALVLGFFSVVKWLGLYRAGLDMTVLAIGTCLVMLAVAQTQRKGGWVAQPLLWLGRHSYEVYLTHMFVVLWLIQTFRALGAPMRWGLSWYGMILALSGLLGAATARGYSEPMNRWIRRRWSGGFHPPAVPAER